MVVCDDDGENPRWIGAGHQSRAGLGEDSRRWCLEGLWLGLFLCRSLTKSDGFGGSLRVLCCLFWVAHGPGGREPGDILKILQTAKYGKI